MGQIVLENIRRNEKVAKLAAPKYNEILIAAKTEKKKQETKKCMRELKTVDIRITELDKIMNKLYEDLRLKGQRGTLPDYVQMLRSGAIGTERTAKTAHRADYQGRIGIR